jgi:hypothetical protein
VRMSSIRRVSGMASVEIARRDLDVIPTAILYDRWYYAPPLVRSARSLTENLAYLPVLIRASSAVVTQSARL